MMKLEFVIAVAFAVMSLISFMTFGIDKYKAKHDKWRILLEDSFPGIETSLGLHNPERFHSCKAITKI